MSCFLVPDLSAASVLERARGVLGVAVAPSLPEGSERPSRTSGRVRTSCGPREAAGALGECTLCTVNSELRRPKNTSKRF